MPTYQYACTNPECGNRFELVQSFTDPAVSECPVCGQSVRKVYGSVGVVFKGSGFYRNDSRSGNGKDSGSTSAHSDTKSESKSDSKAETKKSDSSGSPSSSSSSSSSGDSKSSSSSASSSSGKSAAPA